MSKVVRAARAFIRPDPRSRNTRVQDPLISSLESLTPNGRITAPQPDIHQRIVRDAANYASRFERQTYTSSAVSSSSTNSLALDIALTALKRTEQIDPETFDHLSGVGPQSAGICSL